MAGQEVSVPQTDVVVELAPLEIEPDRVRLRMPYAKERTTFGTTVHGGAIASLLDAAATAAAWSAVENPAEHRGTTIGLTLNFLSAAHDPRLRLERLPLRRGGSITIVEVNVHAPGERPVAQGLVTYKLSRVERSEERPPAELMASLFAGRSVEDQQALLATLERAGAGLYRAWAAASGDAKERDALLEAAEREEQNAAVLERERS
jgi:uncharacterized protein (TIGR00369 family)